MKTIWFTSDTHFGHKNILKHAKRPFATIDEMDEALIANWNARVQPSDDVYHLGDVALCSRGKLRDILERLHGNIHLIRGNHEETADTLPENFVWTKDYHELEVDDADGFKGKRTIILMHYAMRVWNASHYGTWHLYGHSHGELPDDPGSLSFDIGVDCHGFAPVSYEQVKLIMQGKNWVAPVYD